MFSLDIVKEFENDDVLFDHRIMHQPPPSLICLHTHDIFEILFFVRGNISYYINGRIYPLKPHDLIITRPAQPHQIILNENTEYERYLLQFNERILPPPLLARLASDKDLINMKDIPLIHELYLRMDTYCDRLDAEMLGHLFPALVQEVLCNFLITAESTDAPDSMTVHPTLNRALAYIDRNLRFITSIDAMCRELYITKSHLHHLFIEHLQTTPKRYITEKRLFRAKRELHQGKPPTVVSQECGFADYTSFYRNYKNYFGYAPSEEQLSYPRREILS